MKNQKIISNRLVEVLFYSFPIWFVIGNFAVSIDTLLFIIASFFLIKKKKLKFRFDPACWILITFFLYFFIITTIQYENPWIMSRGLIPHWSLENHPIIKSFALVRFLLLIIIIDTLFFNKILSLKKFFLFSLICTSFVSFDIILQYMIGTDLFGYKSNIQWNSGPFGDETIAGTYLKNFSFFSFFYIYTSFENK